MNVKFNQKSKMMEIEFQFRDVKDPNLFRNIYPYNEVPRLVFNHRIVPMNIPEKLYITDTTFRDGCSHVLLTLWRRSANSLIFFISWTTKERYYKAERVLPVLKGGQGSRGKMHGKRLRFSPDHRMDKG